MIFLINLTLIKFIYLHFILKIGINHFMKCFYGKKSFLYSKKENFEIIIFKVLFIQSMHLL